MVLNCYCFRQKEESVESFKGISQHQATWGESTVIIFFWSLVNGVRLFF